MGSTIKNITNSEYSVMEFEIENKRCFATINQYFKNYDNKAEFPYSLWITIETVEQNENGHPTSSEAVLFNQLEDSIIYRLDEKTPYCFIGRTTRDGYREVMIYVSDQRKTSHLMDALINESRFDRKIRYTIDPDETWQSVSGLID